MKAIIPVAGAGAKLRPLTYTQPKALIPIAGKTLLSIIVDQLLEGGVNEFIFVIGYLGEKIRDYVEATYPDLNKQYVQQTHRRGIGHAVWLTRNAVGPDEEVVIVLGDTVAEYDIKKMLSAPVSQIAVRKVDDPRSFGVAEMDAANRIYRVVEKPLIPKSNLAMVGVYYLRESAALFGALEAQLDPVCGKGVEEYHLTHAIQDMIQQDIPIHAFRVDNWYDCGKKETLLATNALLLNQMAEQGDFPLSLAELNAQHPEAVFIPPVHVAPGCAFRQSIIGPNVSIGENTTVARAIIRDSIIGSYAELKDVSLHQSIIGNDAFVHGASQSLNIGDNTEIDLR